MLGVCYVFCYYASPTPRHSTSLHLVCHTTLRFAPLVLPMLHYAPQPTHSPPPPPSSRPHCPLSTPSSDPASPQHDSVHQQDPILHRREYE